MVTFAAAVLLHIFPAQAQDLLALKIAATPTKQVEWTLGELDELDQVTFTTSTIWTDGKVTFSGVPLKTIINKVLDGGTNIQLTALNDYSVAIPIDELEDGVPIVATRIDGKKIAVRDKGPYWLVYPYDSDPRYRTELVYARSIWQLNRIKLLD
ncbi:MAG: oxidoreductase [Pseudomonadota bacterium]